MIGESVFHPQYGPGVITAVFRSGSEWLVRFESGLRFRRPRLEFEGQTPLHAERTDPQASLTQPDQTFELPLMAESQYDARQLIEALRVGIAPARHAEELTVGLTDERARLVDGLNRAHSEGGAAFAVIGDYGFGKTHLVELSAQEGLRRNFLVAATSLDLLELPPHRSFDIYGSLMRNLRYPDTDERGLGPLLAAAAARPRVREQLMALTDVENDPLSVGLYAYANTASSRKQQAWADWLMGGRRVKRMNRGAPPKSKFPSIYRVGHNARQIAYMLSGMSVLARLAGYSGLCVLIDEAESYSLLLPYQRPKASLFFAAVTYAALQERQAQIQPGVFPQHRFRDYPLAYSDRQSLFFLFTVTRSDQAMPLDQWLRQDQVLDLAPHHTPQEVGQYLEKVMAYHALAYSYPIDERQRQIRRGAAEELALGMRSNHLSIRGTVRLGVELFDLLYLYPDYNPAALLDELRRTVRP